ncbi:MAG: response regulator, partial [Bacteriovorax sp.]|nr:response regulator [Bacteriovorax sp.]
SNDPHFLLVGMHVLFADDSLDNQFIIENFLTGHGAIVSLASDGNEAVTKALNSDYHLVLMDIQMPKLDGYQAAKLLFNIGYTKPVIALTAEVITDNSAISQVQGFSGHLNKPFDFVEILDLILNYK